MTFRISRYTGAALQPSTSTQILMLDANAVLPSWRTRTGLLFLTGFLLALVWTAAAPGADQAPTSHTIHEARPDTQATVDNLRAFARLYGYVRFFHPSDAASAVDWDRFAIYGVRQAMDAATPSELRETLDALFAPIAPTVQIYPTDAAPPSPADVLTPTDTAGLNLVAWQHRGVDLGNRQTGYRSIRLSRESETSGAETGPPAIADIFQRIDDATPYHGKEMNVRAAIKTDGGEGKAHLWLFASDPNQSSTAPGDPVTSTSWRVHEWTQPVSENAEFIAFGGFLQGAGTAWFDDFELRVREDSTDSWTEVPIDDSRFEEGDAGEMPDGWITTAPPSNQISTDVSTIDDGVYEGEQAVRLGLSISDGLFEARPKAGEVVNKPLGRGLSAQIPLALYSRDGQTLRPDDAPSPSDLHAALGEVRLDTLTAQDEALRVADVIIAWNVFQHFYPYFDVVDVDWDEVLTRTLQRAASDSSGEDFLQTLRWMVVQLDDGHGRVLHPSEETVGFPFWVNSIEDEVVVAAVRDLSGTEAEPCVRRGDVVVSVEGTPAEDVLDEAKRYISGSPQWKTYRALIAFGQGAPGTRANLVLEREGRHIECEVPRNPEHADRPWQAPSRPDAIEEVEPGIYYIDLTRADLDVIQDRIDEFAEARGVVFDMRGYPSPQDRNQRILQHLSADTLRSAHWQKPHIIYPDREHVAGYDTTGRWIMPPLEPQFTGEIAFLTDGRAISYAESIMGIVEHYALGEIVGRPTAGANGGVNPFVLPGGYRVFWTGMRVVKHDGSQHHLVGIRPTVPVERTIEGVREGRDEDLEAALEVLDAAAETPSR